ncbi:TPA: HNH endonuclease [Klebsiella pneumoniae]
MDSVHHIWCPLSSQEYQDLPDGAETTLTVISATVVDHIKPHKGDETLFHNPDNLQSLCKRCHDSVKQRMEKGGTVTEFDNEGRVIW